jgi:hypothetical protein
VRSTKKLSVVLVLSLVAVPTYQPRAYADDAAAAPAESALTVQPGDLGGNIVDLDGKTPIKGATVQLLDKDGKVVAEASTDEKGVFQLGKQAQGDFTLKVGKASGKLVVKEGAQASSLKFVLEQNVALGAEKAAATKIAAVSTTGAVLIGVGCAVVGLGAGLGIGYGVWGTRGDKKVFVPVGTSP